MLKYNIRFAISCFTIFMVFTIFIPIHAAFAYSENSQTLDLKYQVPSVTETLYTFPVPTSSGVFSAVGSVPGAPWSLDSSSGILTVDTGAIHWNVGVSPWAAYSDNITQIVFTGPITAGSALRNLFADLTNVTSIEGLDYFDTSNTTTMSHMFNGTSALTNIDLSGWNTDNVTNMAWMFFGASSLESVGDLSGWASAGSLTHMRGIFHGASSLTSLNLSGWDTSSVLDMQDLFRNTSALTSIEGLSEWNTESATHMASMFNGAISLETLDLSGWNTNSVRFISRMFYGASSLVSVGDLSGWASTGNLSEMQRMFYGASNLESLNLSGWDTSGVESMLGLFRNTTALTSIEGLADWDTGSVTNMSRMFEGASSLVNIECLSDWDTSNVWTMQEMFRGASNLESLDLSGWNTDSVTNMSHMFRDASSLTSLDLSGWNTDSVTNMSHMFNGASSLTSLDLYNWNTTTVETMLQIFNGTTALRELTLGDEFIFVGGTATALPAVPNDSTYAGVWRNTWTGETKSSAELMTYDGIVSGNWVWHRMHGIAPLDDHVFPPAYLGYGPQDDHIVIVTSTGAQPTGNLNISVYTVSGDPNAFTLLPTSSLASISLGGGTETFTVTPALGLSVGTHVAIVTVYNVENGISESFTVSFTVLAPTTPPLRQIVVTGSLNFGTANVGYSPRVPRPVTITNIGELPETDLRVTIPAGWEFYNLPSEWEIIDGVLHLVDVTLEPTESVSFMVRPQHGLSAGGHNGVVTVTAESNATDSINAQFSVTQAAGGDNGTTENGTGSTGDGRGSWQGSGVGTIIRPQPPQEPPVHTEPEITHLLYIIGYPDGSFGPDRFITRAEVAAMGARIHFAQIGQNTAHFPDIVGYEWFANYIGFTQARGMLEGFPSGNFYPHQNMTRAEFVAMITRFVGITPNGSTDRWHDIYGHWAQGYINALETERPGTILGFPDGTFRADAPITRAEAVTIINRVLDRGVDAAGLRDVTYRSFPDSISHWAYFDIVEASNSHGFRAYDGREYWIRAWQDIWWRY